MGCKDKIRNLLDFPLPLRSINVSCLLGPATNMLGVQIVNYESYIAAIYRLSELPWSRQPDRSWPKH